MQRLRRWLRRFAVLLIACLFASLVYDWSQSVSPRDTVRDRIATVDIARLRGHVERFRSGWLGNLYEACATAYVPTARWYSINRIASWFGDAVRSDHASYWAAGMPAILLSDTAELRNANYHMPTDTPDTLDYEFLLANTKALAATVLHWADTQ